MTIELGVVGQQERQPRDGRSYPKAALEFNQLMIDLELVFSPRSVPSPSTTPTSLAPLGEEGEKVSFREAK